MSTPAFDPNEQSCGACGAPAGVPCSMDCLGLAAYEDEVFGITGAPDVLTPAQQDGLEQVVRHMASRDAAIDANDMYVALVDSVAEYIAHPIALEHSVDAAIPDDFVVWLSRCYRESYTETINNTMHVVSEQSARGSLPTQGAEVDQQWDADLDRVRKIRDLAYPTTSASTSPSVRPVRPSSGPGDLRRDDDGRER